MRELSIGQVAREAGLSASALRYYEKAGLLPAPPRRSRQRRYSEAVFGRIYLIRLALEAGFTIGETAPSGALARPGRAQAGRS